MHSIRIKICGISNSEDASLCLEAGADMLGVVLDPAIPRHGDRGVIESIRDMGGIACAVYTSREQFVGKDMNEDISQLHYMYERGDVEYCRSNGRKIIAVASSSFSVGIPERVRRMKEDNPDMIMVDYRDGASRHLEEIGCMVKRGRIGVAGKIDADNVGSIIEAKPYFIDISSSLESHPGKKDPEKVRAFMDRVGEIVAGHS